MMKLTEETKLVLVTGPSGAGRSTAIHALEDLGFEAIDNLPLSLIPRLLEGPALERPLALGVDARNRDFSTQALMELLDQLDQESKYAMSVLYLDARDDILIRRFSETRRRHPLSSIDAPQVGIIREQELLAPVKEVAEFLLDTSNLTPHELRAEVEQWFAPDGRGFLGISIQSFSYKRGLPRGVDMVFDCRFLRNPHWEPALRAKDGRERAVADFVAEDARFDTFSNQVLDLTCSLLPAFTEEGKTHLTIAFGCTGGKHRSVTLTEWLGNALANKGWQVSKRHRELERRGATSLTEK
ncbi:MAG: RNase adapter RapZ [Litoreibacter sp.]